MYLQGAYRLSEKTVLARWVGKPCFQRVIGKAFLQRRPPIHPASLRCWHARIGEEEVEWLLTKTIEAGRASGAVSERSPTDVAVDTTVVEKAAAHPTDSGFWVKVRQLLVPLARKAGIALRSGDDLTAPRLAAHTEGARPCQVRHMGKVLRRLRDYTGRVLHNLGRKLDAVPGRVLRPHIGQRIALATPFLRQAPKTLNQFYALHGPKVDCDSEGKAPVRFGFGTTVGFATNLAESFAAAACAPCPVTPVTGTLAMPSSTPKFCADAVSDWS